MLIPNLASKQTHYQLIILGAGPAGLTAGLYAARAKIDHLLIEKGANGGQAILTDWIDNYPGFPDGISGFDLIDNMTKQAQRFNLNTLRAEVIKLSLTEKIKTLSLDNGNEITCDTLILCNGARPATLGIDGEKYFAGKGVSYCATCDAPFYKNLEVAVVGGGNTAVQEAIHLTKFASKVTIIHRRDELRATKVIQEKAFANKKIDILWNSQVTAITGDNQVEQLSISNNSGEKSTLNVDGIFMLVGIVPNNEILPFDKLNSDNKGFIITDQETRTNIPGVMAAGDIRSKEVRQVINAAGEGATAALAAEHHLSLL